MNAVWSVKWVIFSGGKTMKVTHIQCLQCSQRSFFCKTPPTKIAINKYSNLYQTRPFRLGQLKWKKWYGNKFFLPFLKKQLWSSFVHFPHEVLCQNIFSPPSQHISDIFWPRCIKQSNMKLHKFCSNSIGQTFVLQIPPTDVCLLLLGKYHFCGWINFCIYL